MDSSVTANDYIPVAKRASRVDSTRRVMWILNHTAARKFELPMLQKLGYEVFTPKLYPNNPNFRSASVDAKWDETLSIPRADLDVMNATDWYAGANRQAWDIANKYFDLLFCILFDSRGIEKTCRGFAGDVLWRTYGLSQDAKSYSRVLNDFHEYSRACNAFKHLGSRFWFTEAYSHLHEIEDGWIQKRTVYLPLGMAGASAAVHQKWIGGDKRVLFVCPDIGFNTAYSDIYDNFKKHFGDLPHAIGGTQSIKVADPNILGYLPLEKHVENMTRMQCMFYHSREPRHIHYHPFEAIKVGMPLVFMSGGMLDRMGGVELPGRAKTWREAKSKLQRILDGDLAFTKKITESQSILLEEMKAENLEHFWGEGLAKIHTSAGLRSTNVKSTPQKVAVLTSRKDLKKALAVARDLLRKSNLHNFDMDVVVGVQVSGNKIADYADRTGEEEVENTDVKIRTFTWSEMTKSEAQRAMIYSRGGREIVSDIYVTPNDQISYFQDCDAWVIVGDRAEVPILPLRPLIYVVHRSQEHPLTYSVPGRRRLGRLGLPPHPEAVVVDSEEMKSVLTKTEGLDSKRVFVIDVQNQSGGTLFDVVLECL